MVCPENRAGIPRISCSWSCRMSSQTQFLSEQYLSHLSHKWTAFRASKSFKMLQKPIQLSKISNMKRYESSLEKAGALYLNQTFALQNLSVPTLLGENMWTTSKNPNYIPTPTFSSVSGLQCARPTVLQACAWRDKPSDVSLISAVEVLKWLQFVTAGAMRS